MKDNRVSKDFKFHFASIEMFQLYFKAPDRSTNA